MNSNFNRIGLVLQAAWGLKGVRYPEPKRAGLKPTKIKEWKGRSQKSEESSDQKGRSLNLIGRTKQ
jgi:hypothetical protein